MAITRLIPLNFHFRCYCIKALSADWGMEQRDRGPIERGPGDGWQYSSQTGGQ